MEQAKQRTQQVAHQGEQKAGQVADQARQKAKGQLSTQKERAAGTLGSVAQALRQSGQHLQEEQDQGQQQEVGQYTERAADQLERFSGHLRERNVDQLIGEAEDFARKRPALFLGGAFALGLLGTRFLKSSSSSSSGQGSGSSEHGSSSGGDGSSTRGTPPAATSGAAGPYGARETDATALPPGPVEEESSRAAGQPLSERTEPVREPTQPPPRRGSS